CPSSAPADCHRGAASVAAPARCISRAPRSGTPCDEECAVAWLFGPEGNEEVVGDTRAEVTQPRLQAIEKRRDAACAQVFEPPEEELRVQLARAAQRLRGLLIRHRLQIRV